MEESQLGSKRDEASTKAWRWESLVSEKQQGTMWLDSRQSELGALGPGVRAVVIASDVW